MIPKQKTTEGQPLPITRHSSLILGPPKTGKTTLARWLFDNPIWWAWDIDGVRSVRPSLNEENILWVPRERPKEHAMEVIEKILPRFKGKADGIVIDDLTFMSRLLTKQAANGSYDLAQIQHYGKSIAQIRDIIEKLKFDYTWLSIAYTSTVLFIYDKEENLTALPNVFGKDTFAPEIPAMVDNVFFTLPAKKSRRKGINRDYYILTEADGVKLAGNRLSPAGDTIKLEAEIDVTIYRNGDLVVNPIRDKLRPVLEGRT